MENKVLEQIKQAGRVDEKGIAFFCSIKGCNLSWVAVSINGDTLYATELKQGMFGTKVNVNSVYKLNKDQVISANFENNNDRWLYLAFNLEHGKKITLMTNDSEGAKLSQILKTWNISETK